MSNNINTIIEEEAKALYDSDDLSNAPGGVEARLKTAIEEKDLDTQREIILFMRNLIIIEEFAPQEPSNERN